ncbi:type II 3-dehydroquinate dehydratase [Halobacteriovorax sp. ZH5_bin.2]|uniref:type II 3-dehydroquinate dehydratase n=1 Tax=unclassified Halobacteriovorax TaxID=2639665 RepID=UPI0037196A61
MDKFLVINGPNLNLLGKREPEIYGTLDLAGIESYTNKKLGNLGYNVDVEWFQSNGEQEIIEKIHAASEGGYKALIINPAAFSHTSIAILDALRVMKCPVIEVHLSNTNLREEFRKNKITAKSSSAVIEGLKEKGYFLAILSQLI